MGDQPSGKAIRDPGRLYARLSVALGGALWIYFLAAHVGAVPLVAFLALALMVLAILCGHLAQIARKTKVQRTGRYGLEAKPPRNTHSKLHWLGLALGYGYLAFFIAALAYKTTAPDREQRRIAQDKANAAEIARHRPHDEAQVEQLQKAIRDHFFKHSALPKDINGLVEDGFLPAPPKTLGGRPYNLKPGKHNSLVIVSTETNRELNRIFAAQLSMDSDNQQMADLKKSVIQYTVANGAFPADFNAVVQAGFLDKVPLGPTDKPFRIEQTDGVFKAYRNQHMVPTFQVSRRDLETAARAPVKEQTDDLMTLSRDYIKSQGIYPMKLAAFVESGQWKEVPPEVKSLGLEFAIENGGQLSLYSKPTPGNIRVRHWTIDMNDR